jgi:hypothetical protein
MKKQLLTICALAVAALAQAQSLQMQDMTSGNIIPSGTTLTETHTDPNTFIDNHVHIINPTTSAINVKVRKTYLYFGTGMDATFCTDQLCYPSNVFLSPQSTPVAANGGILDLKAQYKPESGTPATTAIRYSVFNAANPADSVFFVIIYNGVTGIGQNTIMPITLSNASPNPAGSTFSLNYQLGNTNAGQLVMYNMLGEKVREMLLTEAEGTAKVDVSTLTQGIYFCSLTINGKAVATRRVAVTR